MPVTRKDCLAEFVSSTHVGEALKLAACVADLTAEELACVASVLTYDVHGYGRVALALEDLANLKRQAGGG